MMVYLKTISKSILSLEEWTESILSHFSVIFLSFLFFSFQMTFFPTEVNALSTQK